MTQSEMAAVSGGVGPDNTNATEELTVVARSRLTYTDTGSIFLGSGPDISFSDAAYLAPDGGGAGPPGPDCSGHPEMQTDPLHGNDHDHLPPNIDEIRDLVRLFDQLYGGVVQTSADEIGALIYSPPGSNRVLLETAQYGDENQVLVQSLIDNVPLGSIVLGSIHSHPNVKLNFPSYPGNTHSPGDSQGDLGFQANYAGTLLQNNNDTNFVIFTTNLVQYIASPGNPIVEISIDDAGLKNITGAFAGQIVTGTNGSGGPLAMCGAG